MSDCGFSQDEIEKMLAFDAYLTAEAVRVAEAQEKEQADTEARAAEFEQTVGAYWGRIGDAARALLPEALRPYVVAGAVDGDYEPMPPFGWVAIDAPCCAPVHLYMNVHEEGIVADERALWLPRVVMPDDPDEDGGQAVRYLFTNYAHYNTWYPLCAIGAVMVEARQLYNAHIRAAMEWAQKRRGAQDVREEEGAVESGPATPEAKLRAALEELVNQVLDAGLEARGL